MSKRVAVALVVGGVIVFTIAGVRGCSSPVHHDFAGTVSIRQQPPRARGAACHGRGRDADIGKGTRVVVSDPYKSKVVATTTLGSGTVVTFPGTGFDYSECRFRFLVTIPDRPSYTVQVSDRRRIERNHEEMENDDWTVDIALFSA